MESSPRFLLVLLFTQLNFRRKTSPFSVGVKLVCRWWSSGLSIFSCPMDWWLWLSQLKGNGNRTKRIFYAAFLNTSFHHASSSFSPCDTSDGNDHDDDHNIYITFSREAFEDGQIGRRRVL